jgi:hypothetical protein
MTQVTNTESGAGWRTFSDQKAGTNGVPDCIEIRTSMDGTLDFSPLPLGLRNIWLFNNGGERNDVY